MLITSLPASRFSALIAAGPTVTERTFADNDIHPLGRKLATLSGVRRSAILRQLVRHLDESEWHPDVEEWESAGGGWVRGGERVAVRTAQLRWQPSSFRWGVRFLRTPPEAVCDELLLPNRLQSAAKLRAFAEAVGALVG